MTKVTSMSRLPRRWIDDPGFAGSLKTLRLGAAAGSQKLYVNIDFVKPGRKSVKYHSHSRQEEFFLILEGSGSLRIDGRVRRVKKGDFFAKPAGKLIAHQFINDGRKVLQILDCGLEDPDDVASYPDEGTILVRRLGKAFRLADAVAGWSSDPNRP